jgi:hypothetical protein
MSDLFDDDLLTEADLARLRPKPASEPVVVVEESREPESVEPTAKSPPPNIMLEMWPGPWMGPKGKRALAIVIETLWDEEWEFRQVVAERLVVELGMKTTSAMVFLRKLMQAGLLEKSETEAGFARVRLLGVKTRLRKIEDYVLSPREETRNPVCEPRV